MITTPQTQTGDISIDTPKPLLKVSDLAISFDRPNGDRLCVVNGISFEVHSGQTLALVGESGCGKTVTALSMLKLIPQPPGSIDRGEIIFENHNLLNLSHRAIRSVRGGKIAVIFQEPMTSLNPVYTIGDQIIEAIMLHQNVTKKESRDIAIHAMREVGISNPTERLKAYPHEFSGGMRQRAMIAMALACKPKLLIADEPTTALDVTIQLQILELLRTIQSKRGLSILIITHDLGVVAQVADRVCVMYSGRIVEMASVDQLFNQPLHPYTRALFQSRPRLNERQSRLVAVSRQLIHSENTKQIQNGMTPWWPNENTNREPSMCEIESDHFVLCESNVT